MMPRVRFRAIERYLQPIQSVLYFSDTLKKLVNEEPLFLLEK